MATLVTGRMVEDQSITLNDLTQSSGALMFRNKIINGDMRIDQRNAGTSKSISANTVTYSVDRWYGYSLGSGITQQRVASTVPGLSYALRTTGAASNTQAEATQRIESDTAASMAGQKVTISFYASSSVTKNYTLFVARPTTTTDDYTSSTIIGTYNFTATTALTRYTYTLTLPAQANLGLAVGIVTATDSGGLGAGQYFDLTGVQIEIGEVATPFEWRPIGMELSLCQRYYQIVRSVVLFRANNSGNFGGGITTRSLPVPMRVQPPAIDFTQFASGDYDHPVVSPGATALAVWFRSGSTPGNYAEYNVGLSAEL